MPQFDFLIVGAGPFGCTFARRAFDCGYKSLVIDRRNHTAGNTFDLRVRGINVHQYGPHIFHTNDELVWKFVNQFGQFSQYEHRVKGINNGTVFPVPINLMTMYCLWGITTPDEAKRKIEETRILCHKPRSLEEWMLHQVGRDLYELVVRGYTEKQWGRPCARLPASIIKRLPVRMNWDDRYHNDRFSGLPEEGYANLFENMLDGVEVELESDYFKDRDRWDQLARMVVYTGPIDRFFGYQYGDLHYRSLRFESEELVGDVLGCPQLNFTSADDPHTRIMEWKHFERRELDHTIITREFPQEWKRGVDPFYPIADERNSIVYSKYKRLANASRKFLFGGRLGTYKYLDMDQTIAQALRLISRLIGSTAPHQSLVVSASGGQPVV